MNTALLPKIPHIYDDKKNLLMRQLFALAQTALS